MKQLGKIPLEELVLALYVSARNERVQRVLDRNQLANDQPEEGLLNLCLHFGPQTVIEQVLEEEEKLVEFCKSLDIPYQSEDDRVMLLGGIAKYIFEPLPPVIGFSTVYRYVQSCNETSEKSIPYAFETAKRIEGLIVDIYRLYIGSICYRYLNNEDRNSVKNTFKHSRNNLHIPVSVALDQLERYEEVFSDDHFSDLKDELRTINNQSSILGGVKISLARDMANIRNQYLAHPSDSSQKEVITKAQEALQKAQDFLVDAKETFPKVVFPLQYGVSEWGFKYVAYIDENDVDINGQFQGEKIDIEECQKFYLYETGSEFRPYQKAFCFQPSRSSIVRDPILYYFADLRNLNLD